MTRCVSNASATPNAMSMSHQKASGNAILKTFVATVMIFLVFDRIATALRSDRGQQGIVVAIVVVAAILVADGILFREGAARSIRTLGLGPPAGTGLIAAFTVSVAMVLVLVLVALRRDIVLGPFPGWPLLLPGLFAQGGIAEESLFRGFLFGRLREGRSFLQAATLSLVPFAVAHVVLFTRMPWVIALAALLLAIVMTYPLARLYELGGRTIWAPAVVHFVAQSALKVTQSSGEGAPMLPLVWMAACAVLPYAVFLFDPPRRAMAETTSAGSPPSPRSARSEST